MEVVLCNISSSLLHIFNTLHFWSLHWLEFHFVNINVYVFYTLLPLSPFSIIKHILETALLLVTNNFVSLFGLYCRGIQSHCRDLGCAWLDRARQRRRLPQEPEVLLHRIRNKVSSLTMFITTKWREPLRYLAELRQFLTSQCKFLINRKFWINEAKIFHRRGLFPDGFLGPGCNFYVLILLWGAI